MKSKLHFLFALSASALFAGCGDDDDAAGVDASTGVDAASATTYVPFAASNFAAQQARVAIYEEIVSLRESAAFNQAKCGTIATPGTGTIAEIYTRTDPVGGVLRDKVRGRVDDHSYNMGATIGLTIDADIEAALMQCTAGTIRPPVAAQIVEKSLQRFFYASVYHELALAKLGNAESPEKWDEAFGYFGRSPDGSMARGISGTAKASDEEFNITLGARLFQGFIQGRNQIAAMSYSALATTADELDRNLITLFAYNTAQEFVEIVGATGVDEELAEGKYFFSIIEPYMKTIAAADAATIRTQLDAATYANPGAVDAAGIVAKIEAAFGIDLTP